MFKDIFGDHNGFLDSLTSKEIAFSFVISLVNQKTGLGSSFEYSWNYIMFTLFW